MAKDRRQRTIHGTDLRCRRCRVADDSSHGDLGRVLIDLADDGAAEVLCKPGDVRLRDRRARFEFEIAQCGSLEGNDSTVSEDRGLEELRFPLRAERFGLFALSCARSLEDTAASDGATDVPDSAALCELEGHGRLLIELVKIVRIEDDRLAGYAADATVARVSSQRTLSAVQTPRCFSGVDRPVAHLRLALDAGVAASRARLSSRIVAFG